MMTDKIDPTRLAELPSIMLTAGAHTDFSSGVCAMEMVSWLAREPFSDHPECACPVLGTFVRSWNDSLPDGRRTVLLAPILPRLVGTRDRALEGRRATMAADWYIRTCTPVWLRLAGLSAQADTLEALPEILSFESVPSLHDTLGAIRETASATWSAAWSAARSAAESAERSAAESAVWSAVWSARSATRSAARSAAEGAVWSAARSAAEGAVWSAARSAAESAVWSAAESAARSAAESAARSAAESAVWSAVWSARSAARSTAWSAAMSALKPTVDALQQSALELLIRMIEVA
jgi:hypothetical protein